MGTPGLDARMARSPARWGALAVLLLLAATPTATSALNQSGKSPLEGGWPASPQLYCLVQTEAPKEDYCEVEGKVRDVDRLRARIVGRASVYAFAQDLTGPHAVPLGTADCIHTCEIPLPKTWTSSHVAIYVFVTLGPNSAVMVSLDQDASAQSSFL